jgi:hypothetical protein
VACALRGHHRCVNERDLQTIMQALFDIKTDVKIILEVLLEDENGEETEEDDS